MKRTNIRIFAAACVTALALTGCSPSIESVYFNVPDEIQRGETAQIETDYEYTSKDTPENAEELITELGVTYTSSNESILTVDEDGMLTAVSVGTADVTMTSADGKLTETKTVNVVVHPTSIEMPETFQMDTDDPEKTLTAKVLPEDADNTEIEFTSSDESKLTIDENGVMYASEDGTVTVTAIVPGTDVSAECEITILPGADEITLSNTSITLKKNESKTLTFSVVPENAVTDYRVWTSSDESVATVDEGGNVTGHKTGTCTIRLAMSDTYAECKVTVKGAATGATEKPAESGSASSGSSSSGNSSGSSESSSSSGSSSSGSSSSGSSGATATNSASVPFSDAAGSSLWWHIDSSDSVYWAVLENINAYRTAAGVAPLSISSSLQAIADQRVLDMVKLGDMSHDGYQTPEIIAQNYNSASSVVNAWAASSGHYAAMVNSSYTVCGIACEFEEGGTDYWCVTFG